jgi:cell division protein FtsQ
LKRPQGRPTGAKRPQAPVQHLKAKQQRPSPKIKAPRIKTRSIPQLAVLRPKRSLGRIVLSSSAISVSLLVIFVLVAAFTPLLAVEKIQFKGNERIPTKLLASALSGQIGKPLPQVSLADVSKDLENFTLIQSVSVLNLPPHTLQVRIVERQPICIIKTALGSFLYDPAGVRIASAKSSDEYPIVEAAGKPGASPEFRVAIKALLALPVSLYPRVATVSAPSMDSVTFKLRGWAGQKVIWGDTSQAELKARVLLTLVKHQKKSDRVTYDVSSPKAPTVRY